MRGAEGRSSPGGKSRPDDGRDPKRPEEIVADTGAVTPASAPPRVGVEVNPGVDVD